MRHSELVSLARDPLCGSAQWVWPIIKSSGANRHWYNRYYLLSRWCWVLTIETKISAAYWAYSTRERLHFIFSTT